jgi:outer membrane protein assembly factor BamA
MRKSNRFAVNTAMKGPNLVLILLMFFSTSAAHAQQTDETVESRGFKTERVFLGGGLNLGIGNRSFNLGVNPEIGYSLTNWLDAGLAFNVNYFSQNASDFSAIRYRNFNYGGGAFLRAWPLNFLSVQVQPEYNWISSNQKNVFSNQSATYKFSAGSLLVGVGYGTRLIGSHYSYFSLMIDVLQNINSPYRDQYNDPLPVFRAGFGFYLKPKR